MYSLTYSLMYSMTFFQIFRKLQIQGRMQFFEEMSQNAVNQVLILQNYRTQKLLQIPLKIIDLQNEFNIFAANQWTFRISVPMPYIRLRVAYGGGCGWGVRVLTFASRNKNMHKRIFQYSFITSQGGRGEGGLDPFDRMLKESLKCWPPMLCIFFVFWYVGMVVRISLFTRKPGPVLRCAAQATNGGRASWNHSAHLSSFHHL